MYVIGNDLDKKFFFDYCLQYVKKKRIPQMIFREKAFLGSNFGVLGFE